MFQNKWSKQGLLNLKHILMFTGQTLLDTIFALWPMTFYAARYISQTSIKPMHVHTCKWIFQNDNRIIYACVSCSVFTWLLKNNIVLKHFWLITIWKITDLISYFQCKENIMLLRLCGGIISKKCGTWSLFKMGCTLY